MKYKIGDRFRPIDETLDVVLEITSIYSKFPMPCYTVNVSNMGCMEKTEEDLDEFFELINQNERAKEFLKELTQLSKKYGFEVTAEGTSPALWDLKEKNWIEFGIGIFKSEYEIYE